MNGSGRGGLLHRLHSTTERATHHGWRSERATHHEWRTEHATHHGWRTELAAHHMDDVRAGDTSRGRHTKMSELSRMVQV